MHGQGHCSERVGGGEGGWGEGGEAMTQVNSRHRADEDKGK